MIQTKEKYDFQTTCLSEVGEGIAGKVTITDVENGIVVMTIPICGRDSEHLKEIASSIKTAFLRGGIIKTGVK